MEYKPTNRLRNRCQDKLCDKLETLDFDPSNANAKYRAETVQGLLYLGLGGIDECHNLVTPHSWGYKRKAGDIGISASYAHALTHRREAEHIGEFGTGFNNAGYWFGQTGKHCLFNDVKNMAVRVYENDLKLDKKESNGYGKSGAVNNFATNLKKGKWDPYTFMDLCEKSLSNNDEVVQSYCSHVMTNEWKMLIDHVYKQM